MTYSESTRLIGFLSERFRKAKMKQPWYLWAVADMSWERIVKWARFLGFQEVKDG